MNTKQLEECKFQGKLFEASLQLECSSPVFIRRFMNSGLARRMDKQLIMLESSNIDSLLKEIEDEYGKSTYGKKKYHKEELYWIGFIYRYWNIEFETSSKNIFKMIGSEELRNLYYPYHSLDSLAAIERIMESKKIPSSTEEKQHRQMQIMRAIYSF